MQHTRRGKCRRERQMAQPDAPTLVDATAVAVDARTPQERADDSRPTAGVVDATAGLRSLQVAGPGDAAEATDFAGAATPRED